MMAALADLTPATAPRVLELAARSAYESFMRDAKDDGSLYWPARQWRWPSTVGAATAFTFETEDVLDVHGRGLVYFLACAPPAHLGKATVYLSVFRDREGRELDGEYTYCLRPRRRPGHAVLGRDRLRRGDGGVRASSPRVEVSSYDPKLEPNRMARTTSTSDRRRLRARTRTGSTAPGTRWFMLFRLYGPTDALLLGAGGSRISIAAGASVQRPPSEIDPTKAARLAQEVADLLAVLGSMFLMPVNKYRTYASTASSGDAAGLEPSRVGKELGPVALVIVWTFSRSVAIVIFMSWARSAASLGSWMRFPWPGQVAGRAAQPSSWIGRITRGNVSSLSSVTLSWSVSARSLSATAASIERISTA
jgi:hypothetical protein